MATFWNMRVATLGPREWINVTPLWFGWIAGRGCTVLVDRNPELQAAMFQGHATVLEDAGQEGSTSISKRSAG